MTRFERRGHYIARFRYRPGQPGMTEPVVVLYDGLGILVPGDAISYKKEMWDALAFLDLKDLLHADRGPGKD